METSLHQRMKRIYAGEESQVEQKVGRYIIDVVRDDELIEIQYASLASINRKVKALVADHKVRVVKPLVVQKQLVRCASRGGRVLKRRKSPKRGQIVDIFDELIYFTRVFPHPNLVLEIPLICIEEWSFPTVNAKPKRRRRPKKFEVEDQRLVEVTSVQEFRTAADLTSLLPAALTEPFDTGDLARTMQTARWVAQKMAYCLKHMGAIEAVGKQGNAILYRLPAGNRRAQVA